MPQSSDRLRGLMEKWFGSIDIEGPLHLLLSRGYQEKKGLLRHEVKSHFPTAEEFTCLRFLMEEWDFDYIIPHLYPEDKEDQYALDC